MCMQLTQEPVLARVVCSHVDGAVVHSRRGMLRLEVLANCRCPVLARDNVAGHSQRVGCLQAAAFAKEALLSRAHL